MKEMLKRIGVVILLVVAAGANAQIPLVKDGKTVARIVAQDSKTGSVAAAVLIPR